jgi:predicted phosphodiesterase
MKTWLVLNDIQIPFHDPKVLDLALGFAQDLKPHGVILNGDVTDCYSLSDFSKNPVQDKDIDKEVKIAGELMDQLAKIAKERVWLGGNHEDRLRRYLWNRAPALKKRGVDDFEDRFQIKDHGFIWKPYGAIQMLGKLTVTHGSLVSKYSGQTARYHFDRYGTSILIGHTHRLGVYYRTNVRGAHAAYENGCLCRMNPEYVQHPDWQHGFSVVHVDEQGMFNVQQVPILKRRVFFYGNQKYGK